MDYCAFGQLKRALSKHKHIMTDGLSCGSCERGMEINASGNFMKSLSIMKLRSKKPSKKLVVQKQSYQIEHFNEKILHFKQLLNNLEIILKICKHPLYATNKVPDKVKVIIDLIFKI